MKQKFNVKVVVRVAFARVVEVDVAPKQEQRLRDMRIAGQPMDQILQALPELREAARAKACEEVGLSDWWESYLGEQPGYSIEVREVSEALDYAELTRRGE